METLSKIINILNSVPNQPSNFESTYDAITQLEKLRDAKLHIIQAEYGAIPQEPSIFLTEEQALHQYEQLLRAEGFRTRNTHESSDDYMSAYLEETRSGNPQSQLDPDNTIRWWVFDLKSFTL